MLTKQRKCASRVTTFAQVFNLAVHAIPISNSQPNVRIEFGEDQKDFFVLGFGGFDCTRQPAPALTP
jgi:hypothetical protein